MLAAPAYTRKSSMTKPRQQFLAGVFAALMCAPVSQSYAADGDQGFSVWSYSFYKTVTYEAMARTADIPIYYFVGGAGASSLAFTAANFASGAAVYYLFEVAWNLYGPAVEGQDTSEAVEIEAQKTVLYRFVATARKIVLSYAFTGSGAASLGFALISNAVSAAIYAANDYGWNVYGPPVERGQEVRPTEPRRGEPGIAMLSAAESDALYLDELATAARDRISQDLAAAISDLRQRL